MSRTVAKLPEKAPPPAVTSVTDWELPCDRNGLEKFMPIVAKQLVKALPKFLAGNTERLMRCMITETSKNPALLECTPVSLFGAVIQAGQLGLTIGGYQGEAYLIPFGNKKLTQKFGFDVKEATLIIGYRGMIQLAHRSGTVKRITPVAVRLGDEFRYTRGLHQTLVHVPVRNNKMAVSDYYVVVEQTNDGLDFETFTVQDALEFRDRYSTIRSAPAFVKEKSPWYDISTGTDGVIRTGPGFDAMALKTLVRRIAKRIHMSAEMSEAAGLDEAGEEGHPQNLGAMVDIPDPTQDDPEPEKKPPADKAAELKTKLDSAREPGWDDPPSN